MVAAGVGRLPRLAEVIADAESALALALVELDRDVDPASETLLAALLVAGARLSIETALSNLAKAVSFPAVAPVASGEGPGGPPAPGAPDQECNRGTPQGPCCLRRGHRVDLSLPGFFSHMARP